MAPLFYALYMTAGTGKLCGVSAFQLCLVGVLATEFGNRCHSVATTGTKGYERASRRAFDLQRRCRLR